MPLELIHFIVMQSEIKYKRLNINTIYCIILHQKSIHFLTNKITLLTIKNQHQCSYLIFQYFREYNYIFFYLILMQRKNPFKENQPSIITQNFQRIMKRRSTSKQSFKSESPKKWKNEINNDRKIGRQYLNKRKKMHMLEEKSVKCYGVSALRYESNSIYPILYEINNLISARQLSSHDEYTSTSQKSVSSYKDSQSRGDDKRISIEPVQQNKKSVGSLLYLPVKKQERFSEKYHPLSQANVKTQMNSQKIDKVNLMRKDMHNQPRKSSFFMVQSDTKSFRENLLQYINAIPENEPASNSNSSEQSQQSLTHQTTNTNQTNYSNQLNNYLASWVSNSKNDN